MPAKPRWFCDVERICARASALSAPVLERAHVEYLLGVSRRRAQQILEGCTTGQVGASSVTTAEALSAWLRRAAGEEAKHYEQRRRDKVSRTLAGLHSDWVNQQRLLVEAPVSVLRQRMEGLPEGIELAPGEVRVRFTNPQEGLEKLLALAMAIGNDLEAFEQLTSCISGTPAVSQNG